MIEVRLKQRKEERREQMEGRTQPREGEVGRKGRGSEGAREGGREVKGRRT